MIFINSQKITKHMIMIFSFNKILLTSITPHDQMYTQLNFSNLNTNFRNSSLLTFHHEFLSI